MRPDTDDLIANRILHGVSGLTGHEVLFGTFYRPAHGMVKVVLVSALQMAKLWAYGRLRLR